MRQRLIYLASSSPRRRALVQSLGVPVVTGVAPFDEDAATAAYTGDMLHLAEHLARSKAEATLRDRSSDVPVDAVVLAADTTVVLDGASLGKPRDTDDARRMLSLLRDRTHQVVTGVALASAAGAPGGPAERTYSAANTVRSLSVTTQVTMRAYSDDAVAAYIASGDPLDKAGAYAIQHAGFHPVSAIAGCYLAVVGLPLCALAHLLAAAKDATTAVSARSEAQIALARSSPCPWSSECREPFACPLAAVKPRTV